MIGLLLITLLVAAAAFDVKSLNGTVASSTCGGNCPGGCNECPCGTSKQSESASSWCSKYSGWDQKSCECIMNHESGANAHAANMNTDSSYDVGLWQINDQNWASCSGGKAPCSGNDNLNCAKKVFGWGGNTWKLWSTCSICGVCNSK